MHFHDLATTDGTGAAARAKAKGHGSGQKQVPSLWEADWLFCVCHRLLQRAVEDRANRLAVPDGDSRLSAQLVLDLLPAAVW